MRRPAIVWFWLLFATLGCSDDEGGGDGGCERAGLGSSSRGGLCGGACVDIREDPLNCGACGRECTPVEACLDGVCGTPPPCAPGEERCARRCTNTSSDPRNCGGCGFGCATGLVCAYGRCVPPPCPQGETRCNGAYGACIDLRSNGSNCGACGRGCRVGTACVEGTCVQVPCTPEQVRCFGVCVDLRTERFHCGECGHECETMPYCVDGACSACPAGRTACSYHECVDLRTDTSNCGACGRRCPKGSTCEEGRCVDAPCAETERRCGGACVDVTSSATDCGACGHACAPPSACVAGACVPQEGVGLCGGACRDLRDDAAQCGACGRTCRADQVCRGGTCACAEGETVCSGRCTHLAVDVMNCGACGRACRVDQVCNAGTCECASGWTDCAGACADLQRDPDHCGRCATACDGEHVCNAGACDWPMCGYREGYSRRMCTPYCGVGQTSCPSGCTTLSSPMSCGACGVRCAPWEECATGVCTRRCEENQTVCGVACADLTSDPNHCGACFVDCAPGRACVAGVCDPACGPADTNCGGTCRALGSDVNHCGACGHACADGQVCVEGACVAPSPTEQRSCGVSGTPGCGLVEIGGGTFTLGADDVRDASPSQPNVRVSSFAMDAYEVTVARFRAFWNARSRDDGASIRSRPVAYPNGRSIAWVGRAFEPPTSLTGPYVLHDDRATWTPTPGPFESHPIDLVTRWTAMEFCAWDGGRLPTEAEWEYAARGRPVRCEGLAPGRAFPWGDAAPSTVCVRAQGLGCPSHDGTATAPVGSFRATGGLFDLAGNVAEWMADDYAPFTYTPCWSRPAQQNPLCRVVGVAFPTATVRGGSADRPLDEMRSASRLAPGGAFAGFRCVHSR